MTDERHLLIIEDDAGLQRQMKWCIEDASVSVAGSGKEAETLLRKETPQVVTLDLGLPPDPGGVSEGFRVLDLIRELLPRTKVIVITGQEDHEHALSAVGKGAYDFYQKPIDSSTLNFVVDRAFRLFRLEAENEALRAEQSTPIEGMIAASESMLELARMVEKVAPTDANILILGETGTGKELVARALHNQSQRHDKPFMAINCAAIPENLLESELFGHEKGSFTGAVGRKIGKIEAANGGTLFLDEIGDMAAPLQAKILRFLQERVIERVGGTASLPVDVRVVAATHQPIQEMVGDGSFREDLYFRIAEVALHLPPLRSRGSDSVLLAKAFLTRFQQENTLTLSQDAVNAIQNWSWPGNVRELESRIKRASILSSGPVVSARDLDLESTEQPKPLNLKSVREKAEREAIVSALVYSENNISQTARLLGVSRPTLYNLMEKYDIKTESAVD